MFTRKELIGLKQLISLYNLQYLLHVLLIVFLMWTITPLLLIFEEKFGQKHQACKTHLPQILIFFLPISILPYRYPNKCIMKHLIFLTLTADFGYCEMESGISIYLFSSQEIFEKFITSVSKSEILSSFCFWGTRFLKKKDEN